MTLRGAKAGCRQQFSQADGCIDAVDDGNAELLLQRRGQIRHAGRIVSERSSSADRDMRIALDAVREGCASPNC